MVAIPHDDIADTHGDTDPAGPLDLRAADLDGIVVADIFLDRLGEPWRYHLEVDRTGAQPPPQPAEASREDQQQDADDDGQPFYPAFTADPPAKRLKTIAEAVKAGVRSRQ